jgi:hypothetical protein
VVLEKDREESWTDRVRIEEVLHGIKEETQNQERRVHGLDTSCVGIFL